jgi:hypothetical protein
MVKFLDALAVAGPTTCCSQQATCCPAPPQEHSAMRT